mgnify:CR=1 FL=1
MKKDENRIHFINEHYPEVMTSFTKKHVQTSFWQTVITAEQMLFLRLQEQNQRFAYLGNAQDQIAIVTIVALYEKAQLLPLPDMYGKNLTFKTRRSGWM